MDKRTHSSFSWIAFALGSLFCLSLIFLPLGCSGLPDEWKKVGGQGPKVLVSFTPLYCFAKNVGGEDAKVISLLTNAGPHDYMPTTPDALKAAGAELFLVNGLTLDNFVTTVAKNSGNNKLKIVALAEAIPEKMLIHYDQHHDEKEAGHEDHDHHHHGEHDPHVWLGVPEAIVMVEKIRDELNSVNPGKKKVYDANANAYIKKLKEDVLEYGKGKFAKAKNKKIIATHDSLRYFARAFGLEVVENLQADPGIGSSAAKLKQLVDLCKKDKIKVITVEPQYSQASAKALVDQLKAEGISVDIVVFDTLETAEGTLNQDYYVKVMRENIDRLAEKLK